MAKKTTQNIVKPSEEQRRSMAVAGWLIDKGYVPMLEWGGVNENGEHIYTEVKP